MSDDGMLVMFVIEMVGMVFVIGIGGMLMMMGGLSVVLRRLDDKERR